MDQSLGCNENAIAKILGDLKATVDANVAMMGGSRLMRFEREHVLILSS